MRIVGCCLAVIILSQMTVGQTTSPKLEVTLKRMDDQERQTEQQLRRLLSSYDLSKWLFTKSVIIDSDFRVIPHSHPVLTLSVRHLKDDELLLSTFVHEQLHWYVSAKEKETDEAYRELKTKFPKVPVGYPEGARDEESTYKHILVCYLEWQAMKELLGELRAKQIMGFWATDHYNWIYRTIVERDRELASLMRKHKLLPVGRI